MTTFLPAYPGQPLHPQGGYHRPGGGTAYTAAFLALAGGVWNTLGLYEFLRTDNLVFAVIEDGRTPGWADSTLVAMIGAIALSAFFLLVGSLLLAGRRRAGRSMVIVGALLGVLITLAPVLAVVVLFDQIPNSDLAYASAFAASPWLLVLLLASWGSTGRWIAAGRRP
ncbi:hypothetical protein [Nocardia sp. XZ_19_385]|uniref:hypothetical protein n=1 Tax=Nocardia sp. XZ_19_385 TaxID=2769488 RepID=UPI00188E0E6B|nr:hypothetical protein [Nocardia sp. XZ_19_385]